MTLLHHQRILLLLYILVFSCATVLAYFLHWDTYLYKRTQDTLVIIIGIFGWGLSARSILQGGFSFPNTLALIVFTIITTMHILRAIHGDLIC